MKLGFKRLLSVGAMLLTVLLFPLADMSSADASEIKYIVNGTPITSFDIQKRAAFLSKVQQRSAKPAADEMIDQVLYGQEMKRLNITVADAEVNQAYSNLASSNGMTLKQLTSALASVGTSGDHVKDFIRTQIGWGRVLTARAQATGVNEKDAVRRMLKSAQKPSTTEYVLYQAIFVIPARERSKLLAKRKREAQQIRDQFGDCETLRNHQVKGMIDVTVRPLGRILEPELPPDWADLIKAAKPAGATKVRETPRGIEFIAICSSRTASDDKVAQLVFQMENASSGNSSLEELGKTYTQELRAKSQILKR